MSNGISASQTSQSPLHLRISDGNLPAVLGTFQFEAQIAVLQANATNYVFLDLSQNPPTLVVNQSGFPASDVWTIATAVTNDTKITQLMDSRPAFNSSFAGGGSPGGVDTQLQYNNAGAFGGIAESTYSAGSLTLSSTTFTFEVLSGAASLNGMVIAPSIIGIVAQQPGSQLELNSDSDLSITSDNGNVTFNANNGAVAFAGKTITFASTGANGIKIGSASGDRVGFYGGTSIVKPTVTGAKAGNTTVTLSILAALAALGLITDSTT